MNTLIIITLTISLSGCSLSEINNNLQKTIENSHVSSDTKLDRIKSIQIYKIKLTKQLKKLFTNDETNIIINDIFKDESLINYRYDGFHHEAFIETEKLDEIITKYQNAIRINKQKKN